MGMDGEKESKESVMSLLLMMKIMIFKASSPFIDTLTTVPRAPITISINITFCRKTKISIMKQKSSLPMQYALDIF